MNYKIKIDGAEHAISILKFEGTTAQLTINGVDFEVEIEGFANPARMGPKPVPTIRPVAHTMIQPEIPLTAKNVPATSGSSYELKSPLPGVILEILVKEGDTVKAGQQVLVLEAMKMENSIPVERAGVVGKISRVKGDIVLEGDVILTIS